MSYSITRRSLLGAAALMTGSSIVPAFAQDKPTLRFSAIVSDRDIRATMMQKIADEMANDFKIELHYNGTLFKQGTELVALQRGNLEMGNIAPQDYSKQIPAWSILTSAYLFRDANHMKTFFGSDLGAEMKKMVEDQLEVRVLGPTFFGTRQVGLKPDKKITTPADMADIKLRMPGGDAWQFLGKSLGANPVAMPVTEVYTALQTGAVDGQDNPLPNVKTLKFNEVMSQIVLTSHLVGFDLLTISSKAWGAMSTDQQQRFQAAADKAIDWSTAEHLKQEGILAEEFKGQGLKVYTPDVAAFREHSQNAYRGSDLAESWPEGMVEKIAAL